MSKLSYSHLRVLLPIEDSVVRYSYEQQCMRETWSIRELRRQVASNLHIRVGLSRSPEKCLALAVGEDNSAPHMVRDQYALEFLGLRGKDVVTETDLENASMRSNPADIPVHQMTSEMSIEEFLQGRHRLMMFLQKFIRRRIDTEIADNSFALDVGGIAVEIDGRMTEVSDCHAIAAERTAIWEFLLQSGEIIRIKNERLKLIP